ncbi:protein-glutamate methylesterase/protein-glutamine glutaminase [Selenihalanaerobacter shriftii]|uniref:Protein-glutamate methylesterase/protein-glutamine glutaminase n=1 Tax=Selenihalanaerobacter shriftii TaxID=142842 RepID=A0A1T4JJ43_9FIRM|nr:chemotaxis response regulator protein-glutamate methylesterase [Selenihalanaerobacter shriftii]SJZ30194.1 two-component system, chemotaxis family, response regulator CheB [Selenihalanaerobacter shriftii]
MASEIKVLVVDDSAFMRKMISSMLDIKGIKVIDTARNGKDALNKLKECNPDVITLDVEMPIMNGLEFLHKLMGKKPLPVIMLSSLTEKDSMTTIKALELGAVDFIPKPSGTISLDIDQIENELIKKIKAAAKSTIKRRSINKEGKRNNIINLKNRRKRSLKTSNIINDDEKIIVIGSSTGGPRALKSVISKIPADFNLGILLVQHMPAEFTKSLAKRLNRLSGLEVKEANDGDKIKPGKVLLAPGDYHMLVTKQGKIKLNKDKKVHNIRPAIDLTMESAVQQYGSGVLGVILTGMGKDGTQGLKAIKEAGGYTIAQDKKTSVVYGMPKSAFEAGVVDSVKPLSAISSEIIRLSKKIK